MTVRVQGMQGLGDNIHERAVVRQLMERSVVFLETPWPSVFHDLVGPRLQLTPSETRLRTQVKNVAREGGKYTTAKMPNGTTKLRVWYTHEQMRRGPILKAMMETTGTDFKRADFSLPIPYAWHQKLDALLAPTDKPLLVYRPLVERTEWGGCTARNPDFDAYAALFKAARTARAFHAVSVADLVQGREWQVGMPVPTNQQFHAGELPFEALAALFSRAALVFTSPGFATILAQAVKVPVVTVFGGHEDSRVTYPTNTTLCIDPIKPCCCLSHKCAHSKAVDVATATNRLKAFINDHCIPA